MSMPQDHDSDDPWMLRPNGVDTAQPMGPEGPALRIAILEGVAPLGSQIGVFPKKAVPDALCHALLGQPEPTAAEIDAVGGDASAVPPLLTYAILDAAKVANLPELLERSGLEHRCLFKGDAYDELKNVAPWIVRLDGDENFTRNLFTRSDASWHLWDKEPGIYVRSRCDLNDLWRHLRKFTRVQDDDGQWFYFRFWESDTVQAFLERANWTKRGPLFDADKLQALILTRSEGKVTVIGHGSRTGAHGGESFQKISRDLIQDQKTAALRDYFRNLTPKRFRAIGQEGQDAFLQHLMRRASKLGVTAYSEIAYLGCLMQNFGCWVDVDPTYRRMNRFLSAPEYQENPHRMDLLHEERTAFIKKCVGEKGLIDLRYRKAIMDYLSGLNGRYDLMDRAEVTSLIQSRAPGRFNYAGAQAVSDLSSESERLARRFGLNREWHLAAFLSLSYAIGIGFFDDPFYPWAKKILSKSDASADERTVSLMLYAEKRLKKSIIEAEGNV